MRSRAIHVAGKLKQLGGGVRAEPQHGGACVLYQNSEVRQKILPGLLGLKTAAVQKYMESFSAVMKEEAVRQRWALSCPLCFLVSHVMKLIEPKP